MDRLQALYQRYQTELRPLIIDFESREEKFPESILYDVPFMFDRAAEYITNAKPEALKEAEECLDFMLDNIKTELLASYMRADIAYQKRYDVEVRSAINGGKFSREYNRLRADALMARDAGDISKAITLFDSIEKLRNANQPTAMSVRNLRQSLPGFLVELSVSIIISVIIGIIIAEVL